MIRCCYLSIVVMVFSSVVLKAIAGPTRVECVHKKEGATTSCLELNSYLKKDFAAARSDKKTVVVDVFTLSCYPCLVLSDALHEDRWSELRDKVHWVQFHRNQKDNSLVNQAAFIHNVSRKALSDSKELTEDAITAFFSNMHKAFSNEGEPVPGYKQWEKFKETVVLNPSVHGILQLYLQTKIMDGPAPLNAWDDQGDFEDAVDKLNEGDFSYTFTISEEIDGTWREYSGRSSDEKKGVPLPALIIMGEMGAIKTIIHRDESVSPKDFNQEHAKAMLEELEKYL